MQTIFDKATQKALISRINTLTSDSKAEWGTMNVYQMLKHCTVVDEMYLGKKAYKRMFLGRLLGKWALGKALKDDAPMEKNAPTDTAFKITEVSGDVEAEKSKWIRLIQEYEIASHPELMHWFFGKMTKDQVGQLAYKHIDHHLRQFNA